jgi:hypothetical protein
LRLTVERYCFFGCHFAVPFFEFFAAFFVDSNSAVSVAVGADKAINTAKLVGGGNAAPQPTISRPKNHAAHFFIFTFSPFPSMVD